MKYERLLISGPVLPENLTLAISGGVDSMAALDYLVKGKRKVSLLYVDHKTDFVPGAIECVEEAAKKYGLNMRVEAVKGDAPSCKSHENWWRQERYKIFHATEGCVVTCHHLDDCMETWIWSSLRGESKIIPYANKNVVRPFRTCRKDTFYRWAKRNKLSWAEDPSNGDTYYTRNYIRHILMPKALVVNPGLAKTVRKKILDDLSE